METETILESILEWDGSFDEFTDTQTPLTLSSDLHDWKRIDAFSQRTTESEISGYEDWQSASLECTITSQ